MGFIDPIDEYAGPPRIGDPAPTAQWGGWTDPTEQYRELRDVRVEAGAMDLDGCAALEISTSALFGAVLEAPALPDVDLFHSTLDGCDLSRCRFSAVRGTRFTDCKLVGTDFSGGELTDVVFDRCVLRLVDLRSARLVRVAFVDCVLEDVDARGLSARDVTFAGSRLEEVLIDGLRASAVDFRGALELGLTQVSSLRGCLVADEQLATLVYQLALAAGADIERSPTEP